MKKRIRLQTAAFCRIATGASYSLFFCLTHAINAKPGQKRQNAQSNARNQWIFKQGIYERCLFFYRRRRRCWLGSRRRHRRRRRLHSRLGSHGRSRRFNSWRRQRLGWRRRRNILLLRLNSGSRNVHLRRQRWLSAITASGRRGRICRSLLQTLELIDIAL